MQRTNTILSVITIGQTGWTGDSSNIDTKLKHHSRCLKSMITLHQCNSSDFAKAWASHEAKPSKPLPALHESAVQPVWQMQFSGLTHFPWRHPLWQTAACKHAAVHNHVCIFNGQLKLFACSIATFFQCEFLPLSHKFPIQPGSQVQVSGLVQFPWTHSSWQIAVGFIRCIQIISMNYMKVCMYTL